MFEHKVEKQRNTQRKNLAKIAKEKRVKAEAESFFEEYKRACGMISTLTAEEYVSSKRKSLEDYTPQLIATEGYFGFDEVVRNYVLSNFHIDPCIKGGHIINIYHQAIELGAEAVVNMIPDKKCEQGYTATALIPKKEAK